MYIPHFPKDKIGIPYLSMKKISAIAQNYVADFCPEMLIHPCEFNIEKFMEVYMQLTLDIVELSHNQSRLGMTVFNSSDKVEYYDRRTKRAEYMYASKGTIIIDSSLYEESQEHRLRFTIGHECGHWIFHRDYYGYDENQISLFEYFSIPYNKAFITCKSVNNDYDELNRDTWPPERWMEWHADKFASGILMPEEAVRKVLKTCSSEIVYVDAISDVFNVSKLAALYRLRDLNVYNRQHTSNQISMF